MLQKLFTLDCKSDVSAKTVLEQSCTGTNTVIAFSSITQPTLPGFTRFTRYNLYWMLHSQVGSPEQSGKMLPNHSLKTLSNTHLERHSENLLIRWLCLLFNFLSPVGWTNTSDSKTLLIWHISLWKVLFPKMTLISDVSPSLTSVLVF